MLMLIISFLLFILLILHFILSDLRCVLAPLYLWLHCQCWLLLLIIISVALSWPSMQTNSCGFWMVLVFFLLIYNKIVSWFVFPSRPILQSRSFHIELDHHISHEDKINRPCSLLMVYLTINLHSSVLLLRDLREIVSRDTQWSFQCCYSITLRRDA